MRDREPHLRFRNRSGWRRWLRGHQEQRSGVWLLLYKRHVQHPFTYDAAVEEALCFGWIDGQLRRVDDDSHYLRFSPRREKSVWAPSNIARVKRLLKERRMTPAGLRVFRSTRNEQHLAPSASAPASLRIPPELRAAFAKNALAQRHFLGYPPSFRRTVIWWVRTAKRPETRARRIKDVVRNAARYAKPHY